MQHDALLQTKPLRTLVLTTVSLVVISIVVFFSRPSNPSLVASEKLQASDQLHWYRGNMHTHSLWSDGDDFLEMIGLWYRDHGYDFLVYTDHNTLADKERWVDVNKNKNVRAADDKLKAKFPKEWIEERTRVEEVTRPIQETPPANPPKAKGAEKSAGSEASKQEKPSSGVPKQKTPETKSNPATETPKLTETVKVTVTEVRLKKFDEVFAKLTMPGKYLLIQGEEITDKFGKLPIHMNAHNVKSLLPPLGGDSVTSVMQNNVNAVIAQRERTKQPMFVHLNHPNFGYGVTAEDLAPVRGENFFEVYNGHPGVNNMGDDVHASCERIWDIVNTIRLTDLDLPLLYGLATDDGHNYHNIPSRASEPGRGWVMVLAPELSPAALIDAMEAGRFYASSGVMLDKVETTPKSLSITIAPDKGVSYTVEFIGSRKGTSTKGEPVLDKQGKPRSATKRYTSDIGAIFKTVSGLKEGKETSATYEFKGDELYVRARITSSRNHPNPSAIGESEHAWTQPVRP